MLLVPPPGRNLKVGGPEPVEDSPAGEAFLSRRTVEVPKDGSVRMYLPLLDGSDQIAVMAVTLDSVDDDDRRLLLRGLAGLVADMIVTKDTYTDRFFQARRSALFGRPHARTSGSGVRDASQPYPRGASAQGTSGGASGAVAGFPEPYLRREAVQADRVSRVCERFPAQSPQSPRWIGVRFQQQPYACGGSGTSARQPYMSP